MDYLGLASLEIVSVALLEWVFGAFSWGASKLSERFTELAEKTVNKHEIINI